MRTIVLIEDDDLMRGLLSEWLAAEGYSVRIGSIDGAAQPEAAVDLVIVDILQPRRLGAERVRRARSAHPGAALIAISSQFCTGAAAGCVASNPQAAALPFGADRLIAKPFCRRDLLAAVRALVDSGTPAQVNRAAHARQPA